MANYTDNAVESAVLNDAFFLRARSWSATEYAALNDDSASRIRINAVEAAVLNDAVFERSPTRVLETAVLDDAVSVVGAFVTKVVDSARLNDAAVGTPTNWAVEAAVLSDAVSLKLDTRTVEVALLNDLGDSPQHLMSSAAEAAVLNDAYLSVMIDKVAEAAALNDAASAVFRARDLVLEIAVLNDASTGLASKTDLAEESAVLNDATSQHLHGLDRVIEVGYLSDLALGGSGAAWRAHLEPLAMSRYDNFEFTSLAVIDGRLVGTGTGGVFVLEGATDAGSLIDAEIVHDWTDRIEGDKGAAPDSRLKRPRHVYLNARVTGVLAFVLGCVEDGAEVEYDYSLPDTTATGFINIRAPLGRGIRSRYLRPVIRNVAGADFEINDGKIVVDSLARSV